MQPITKYGPRVKIWPVEVLTTMTLTFLNSAFKWTHPLNEHNPLENSKKVITRHDIVVVNHNVG